MPFNVHNEDQIRKLAQRSAAVVKEAVQLTALELWGNIRENSPVDHGRLAGSWQMKRLSPLQYRVSTAVKYARWVNDGTGMYRSGQPITPKRARVLVFQIKGRAVFAQSVHGMKGRKYIEKSIDQTENRKEQLIQMALQKVGLI